MVTRRVVVHGLVQGVGFRYSMVRRAQELGLVGTVRNREDGAVEAVATGDEAAVAALADWAQDGPTSARVDRVEVEEVEPQGWTGFTVVG